MPQPTHTSPRTDGRTRAPLPPDRAFVVQLRADADLGGGALTGRIEHVRTGTATLFDSADQMVAWMRDVVARTSAAQGE